MGFTKLDEGILQSSIMAETATTFKVWIAFLASCDPDGIARVSSVFIASACHLGLATVDRAIEVLSSPDPRSRTLTEDGRRIVRVDGGYRVVNYEKYRAFTPNEGDPNSPGAMRTRRWRERKNSDVTSEKAVTFREGEKEDESVTTSPVVTHGDACDVTSASASASSSLNLKGEECEKGGAVAKVKIAFNAETLTFDGVTTEKRALWAKAYPACDIDVELAKAAVWILENPAKGHKSNWGRFLANWLSRAQDHGGTRGNNQSNRSATRPRTAEEVHAEFEAARKQRGF